MSQFALSAVSLGFQNKLMCASGPDARNVMIGSPLGELLAEFVSEVLEQALQIISQTTEEGVVHEHATTCTSTF